MKRRAFIGLSASYTAALVIPFQNGCAEKSINAAIAEPAFLMSLLEEKTIRETGRAYIELFADEKDKFKLARLISDLNVERETSAGTVRSLLEKKCVEDFEKNNIIIVNGWVLSRTEARQCALFELMHPA